MDSCHLIKSTNIFAYKKINILSGYKVDFLKELKTNNNQLKPHVKDLDLNATYYSKKCIKCTICLLYTSDAADE